jgi:hypothetical protein
MEDELYAPDPERWRRLGRRFGWMLAALFLLFGTLYLFRASGWFEPAPLRLADVRLTPPPPYDAAAFLREVQKLGALPAVLPAEQGPNFPALARALARHPWIASVEEFRWLGRGGAEFAVTYRLPVFELEQGGRRFFLAVDGLVLNYVANHPAEPVRLSGLAPATPIEAGMRLPAADLQPALAAANVLRAHWRRWRLAALEYHNDGIWRTLRVHAGGGSIIVWGSLDRAVSEVVSDAEKLRRLEDYWREFGSFEKPSGPYLLDVRPKGGLLRRGLP